MRRPIPGTPPEPPQGLALFVVRYSTRRAGGPETASSLHRTLPAARRRFREVERLGGTPTLHVTAAVWQPLERHTP